MMPLPPALAWSNRMSGGAAARCNCRVDPKAPVRCRYLLPVPVRWGSLFFCGHGHNGHTLGACIIHAPSPGFGRYVSCICLEGVGMMTTPCVTFPRVKARILSERENSSGNAWFPEKLFHGLHGHKGAVTSRQNGEGSGDTVAAARKAKEKQRQSTRPWWS